MVTIVSLWLPILLSAAVVFVVSALVWMVLPHHKNEYRALPNEDAARAALAGTAPGQYTIPFTDGGNAMKDPAVVKKMEEGPVGFLTLRAPGVTGMGPQMVQSFLYYVFVAGGVAYLATRTLDPGTHYLSVFRVVGTTAWFALGFGIIPDSIWFGRPWSSTVKHLIDALVYAMLMAGIFGWRWPAA